MTRGIGLALLVVGIALIVYGAQSTNSIASDMSRFFTGSPTNKAMWLLFGGIAAAIVGFIMTLRPGRIPNK